VKQTDLHPQEKDNGQRVEANVEPPLSQCCVRTAMIEAASALVDVLLVPTSFISEMKIGPDQHCFTVFRDLAAQLALSLAYYA
jgi:hypothetical protein